ncbi:hypothetical protein FCH28_08700 [Streptomyces piniterrae]|uniref:DNA-directed RNA polymerase specialized sigma24 family protein n=1 Tax=Streptomyces piniterrae TaxID=2571125 RepID=A0A4U0NM22_9ACTN|nr:hypothetical protein [Streptomyces piniterrae]TJZ55435.1 hypothetical protein FCH28_08700 [Streptomyces piniterrae]
MDERTRADVERAEAAIVEHYPRLVRLAYLVLPPSMGRHRRVLTAHGLVQRALPRARPRRRIRRLPAQRGPVGEAGYGLVRLRTLRLALAYEGRPQPPAALPPSVPVVWGLRLFPRAGGADELALDQALSAVPAPVRAAVGLWHMEGLDGEAARGVLAAAGVADPDAAQRAAGQLDLAAGAGAAALLNSGEFDPCTVQIRPTDLLRRRQRVRTAVAVVAGAAVLAVGALVAGVPGGRGDAPGHGAEPTAAQQALDPARLLRTPNERWADTARVDFTAWPARGRQAGDQELLGRALRVWAAPPEGTRILASATTSTRPPDQPPQLLYAGLIDNVMVVVFHDGGRLVRYAEPADATPTLHFARVDDADMTTGGALVIGRGAGWMRYLVAPWVATVETRDLLAPDAPARPLRLAPDGVSNRVPIPPGAGAGCGQWPAVQFHVSERIAGGGTFLVTDLDDLVPVRLTSSGAVAGAPALRSWARTACSLRSLRGAGVRSVNNWGFARQSLPEHGGSADWVCTRADTWRGPGRVTVRLQPPAARPADPGWVAGRAADTAACSRFGRPVVGGVHWRAKSGTWYLLAAGGPEVAGIDTTGSVRASAEASTLAVRAARPVAAAPAEVTGRLRKGGSVRAVRP